MHKRYVCLTLCVSLAMGALASAKAKTKTPAKPIPKKVHFDKAYYNGTLRKLHAGPYEAGERTLVVGPWNLGPKLSPKPNDKRANLYFLAPGTQHQLVGHPEYDHTEILSSAPEEPKEFDVFWAVVLDPTLNEEFNTEQQLIMATQETFQPDANFTFDQIPAAGFLKALAKISTLDGLDKYRRPDGSLPRMAIITAGFAVRFSAEKPEEKPPEDNPTGESPKQND